MSLPTIDNIKYSGTVSASAAGLQTLTSTSPKILRLNGSAAQSVQLPATSTLTVGVQYEIINRNTTAAVTGNTPSATGAVIVQSSGANQIAVIPGNTTARFTVVDTALTTAAAWAYEFVGVTSLAGLEGYTTHTAAGGGTVTLTKDSTPTIHFTGAQSDTLVMPVTTTLYLGQKFRVINNQAQTIAVQTSAGTALATQATNSVYEYVCIGVTTGVASWVVVFIGTLNNAGATMITGTGVEVLATSPTLTTPNIGAATGTSLATTGALSTSAGAITAVGGSVTARAATTQDGVILTGRAGGTTTLGVTLTPTTLTASRTLTLPDTTGTVVTTGDTQSVTSTMILDGTILNADVNASAAIDSTKLTNWENDQVVLSGQVFG
jgi:hypothetical protein